MRLVAPVPFGLTLKEAATAPLSGCAAYESLLKLGLGNNMPLRGGTNPTLLAVGGAGGVGSWATQLARVLYPTLNIVATASSAPKGSVDYILCLTEPTPTLFSALSEVIRPYGSICLVAAGMSIKSLDLSFVFFKAATVTTRLSLVAFEPTLNTFSLPQRFTTYYSMWRRAVPSRLPCRHSLRRWRCRRLETFVARRWHTRQARQWSYNRKASHEDWAWNNRLSGTL